MGSVKEMVDAKIAGKTVMMFSKKTCPFCKKAKEVLKTYNLSSNDYEVLEIDDLPECSEIQDYLKSITGARSVPRVFIKGTCIGGGDETVQAHRSGELQKALEM